MKEWRSYKEKLKECVKESNDSDKKSVEDAGIIISYLEELRDAVEEMVMDEMDRIMAELESYRYPSEIQNGMEDLSAHVLNMDEERAVAQIEELLRLVEENKEWRNEV